MFKPFLFLLDLLFPISCSACGREGEYLCQECLNRLKFNEKKYFLNTPNLDHLLIAGDYDDKLLAELIKKHKFNYQQKIGPYLARFLCSFWNQLLDEKKLSDIRPSELLVIPIPLSKKRARARGFNQSAILAQIFCESFSYELNTNLKRIKNRPPQSSLNEKARAKNIKDVFAWSEIKTSFTNNQGASNNRGDSDNKSTSSQSASQILKNKTIILIDDVVTTGATLNEAAKILKTAGANKVYGLVLAKG